MDLLQPPDPEEKFTYSDMSIGLGMDISIRGEGEANETAIGHVPTAASLDVSGLDIDGTDLETLLSVDNEAWRGEVELIRGHFESIGERLPNAMRDELSDLEKRLAN